MSKFFNEIVAPQLTQTDYGQGIESMVNNINANFQKVFTLPFLKGDDGDRLTTRFCPFWEKPEGVTDPILTEEGYKIFEAIFIDEKIKNGIEFENTKPGCVLGDLMKDLSSLFTKSENSGETQFVQTYGPEGDPKILLYYLIDTESNDETLLGAAQLYYFFDPRIQGLSDFIGVNNTESVEGFVDYTCILSTKYVNGDQEYSYEYEKQSGWPTLYFDSSSKQFCWQINGQKTGVNAQGVNGRDGRGSKIWLCVVEPDKTVSQANSVLKENDYLTGDYCKFKITKLWVPKVNGWLNINEENDYKTALNALGDSGLPSSGDIFISYLDNDVDLLNMPVYAAGVDEDGNPIYEQVTEDGNSKVVAFKKPPVSLYGTLFYNSQSSDPYNNKYFVFSNISQNLYRSTDNTVLIDMLNNIGDLVVNSQGEDGVQAPVRSPKGLFLPLLKLDNETHDHVHVIYNDRNDGSLNLGVDKYANVACLVEGNEQQKSEESTKDLNIVYNTNLKCNLNVTGSTNLSDKLIVDGDGTTITGTTKIRYNKDDENRIVVNKSGIHIRTGAKENENKIIVNSTGVGINTTPSSSYDLTVGGVLGVTENTILKKNLTVDKETILNDILTVNGAATLNDGLTVSGALTTTNIVFDATIGKDWYIGGYLDFYGKKVIDEKTGKVSYGRSLRLYEREGELCVIDNGGVNLPTDGYGSATINTGVLKSRGVNVGSDGLSVTGATALSSTLDVTGKTTLKNSNLVIGNTSNNNLSIDLQKSNKKYNISIDNNHNLIIKDSSNFYDMLKFNSAGSSASVATFANKVAATTFKGELDGNATSATKLETARNFVIGGVTKSFDGTAGVTITKSEMGLDNVKNTAFYERVTTVNNTDYKMAGTVSGNAFKIFAPTSAGSLGQVLVSNGSGAPSWKSTININSVSATSLSSWSRVKNLSRGYNYCTYTYTKSQSGGWYGYTINLNSSQCSSINRVVVSNLHDGWGTDVDYYFNVDNLIPDEYSLGDSICSTFKIELSVKHARNDAINVYLYWRQTKNLDKVINTKFAEFKMTGNHRDTAAFFDKKFTVDILYNLDSSYIYTISLHNDGKSITDVYSI